MSVGLLPKVYGLKQELAGGVADCAGAALVKRILGLGSGNENVQFAAVLL
jgi:hypothetical protein